VLSGRRTGLEHAGIERESLPPVGRARADESRDHGCVGDGILVCHFVEQVAGRRYCGGGRGGGGSVEGEQGAGQDGIGGHQAAPACLGVYLVGQAGIAAAEEGGAGELVGGGGGRVDGENAAEDSERGVVATGASVVSDGGGPGGGRAAEAEAGGEREAGEMSSVYVLEPPTKGKVVVQTTAGPLDIELWPKEAPKAVRNFVQLCLEGYYDGTLFHRVIKSFLVQGGDPTGSGTGGESIYGAPFADEFHTRLRFNHRGLVACANAGTPHSNGSQFFISLDRCDWLDKKNTIFGKVTGDSIFNLLALADIETDKDDRPVYPQKILSVEVLWNPFDDIVPRQLKKTEPTAKGDIEGKSKKKAVK
jgi:cyclophilin family peptidyl-prolyl cis-trans isomerase